MRPGVWNDQQFFSWPSRFIDRSGLTVVLLLRLVFISYFVDHCFACSGHDLSLVSSRHPITSFRSNLVKMNIDRGLCMAPIYVTGRFFS